jgi:hypothetical protein
MELMHFVLGDEPGVKCQGLKDVWGYQVDKEWSCDD